MGILGSLAKAGVAKKLFSEARKPENQRKLKRLWSKATGNGSGNGSGKGSGKRR